MTDALPTFHGFALGALPDPPDPRDHLYAAYLNDHPDEAGIAALPPKAEVAEDAAIPIFAQGNLGSCTANEAVAHYMILQKKEGRKVAPLSRLQVYYEARRSLGEQYLTRDVGATGRACADVLHRLGACLERDWPYKEGQFAVAPGGRCVRAAGDHQLIEYLSIKDHQPDTLDLLKTSLAAGYPVGFSFMIYRNFHPDANGVIPMPSGAMAGGHRMLLVGYDANTGLWHARNSWYKDWGVNGRCYFHEDHVLQGFSDFWTYRSVE